MKKLLISSLKFFSLSAVKFFLLQSARIRSFCLSNRVLICELLTSWSNRSPRSLSNRSSRSLGHRRRRLTDRHAFSLGVIDMYSVCFAKHILECGVIVLHVLEEPLLRELRVGSGTLCRTRRKSP